MASLLAQTSMVNNIASSLLMPKRSIYSQKFMHSKIELHSHIQSQNTTVLNNKNQKLKVTILSHKQSTSWDVCIVFLHGYGSNRIESINLLHVLPRKYLLISFDFSGSGKSDGQLTTFGIKQSEDIKSILKFSRANYAFDKLILWGRSMGAVASLLYTCKYQGVDLQVVDSPFCSFQQIAQQWAGKQMHIPSWLTYLSIAVLKQKFKSQQHNPFEIQLSQMVQNCKTRALFIYCEKDTVVSQKNSCNLIKKFRCSSIFNRGYQIQSCKSIIIDQNHNEQRNKQTLNRITKGIQAMLQQSSRCYSRSFSEKKIMISIEKKPLQKPITMTCCSLQKVKKQLVSAKNDKYLRKSKGFHQVVSKKNLLQSYASSKQSIHHLKMIFNNPQSYSWNKGSIKSYQKFSQAQKFKQSRY